MNLARDEGHATTQLGGVLQQGDIDEPMHQAGSQQPEHTVSPQGASGIARQAESGQQAPQSSSDPQTSKDQGPPVAQQCQDPPSAVGTTPQQAAGDGQATAAYQQQGSQADPAHIPIDAHPDATCVGRCKNIGGTHTRSDAVSLNLLQIIDMILTYPTIQGDNSMCTPGTYGSFGQKKHF